jgi:hypothetical protein
MGEFSETSAARSILETAGDDRPIRSRGLAVDAFRRLRGVEPALNFLGKPSVAATDSTRSTPSVAS